MNFTLPMVFTVFKIRNVICLRQSSVLNKNKALLNQSSFNKLFSIENENWDIIYRNKELGPRTAKLALLFFLKRRS